MPTLASIPMSPKGWRALDDQYPHHSLETPFVRISKTMLTAEMWVECTQFQCHFNLELAAVVAIAFGLSQLRTVDSVYAL
jgi:hypothetical protein